MSKQLQHQIDLSLGQNKFLESKGWWNWATNGCVQTGITCLMFAAVPPVISVMLDPCIKLVQDKKLLRDLLMRLKFLVSC
jgi:hypothetical protein